MEKTRFVELVGNVDSGRVEVERAKIARGDARFSKISGSGGFSFLWLIAGYGW